MEKVQKWFEEIKNLYKPDDTTIDSDRNLPDLDLDKIENKINERLSKESGIDRIKELFTYDETIVGGYPEILTETHGLIQGAFVAGFLVGAVAQTKETNEAFKRNTQLTVYVDKKMATRSYIDYVYMQTVKGGLKYGIKYSVFSGIILGSSLLIQAYRNKSNPFDYSAGGAIAGLLLRMHHGLRNGLTGIAVGGLFGTIFGIARYSQLKFTNATYEERRHERLKQKFVLQELLNNRPNNEKTNIADKK